MIEGLIWLLTAQLCGELLAALTGIPIPGPVLGMVLLLLVLILRGGPSRSLADLSAQLLRYLPLILIPPSVGLMDHLPLLRENALLLAAVIIGTTLVSLLFSGWLNRRLLRGDSA